MGPALPSSPFQIVVVFSLKAQPLTAAGPRRRGHGQGGRRRPV